MQSLSTPEDRFKDLPNYPFDAHYLSMKDGLKMHYLDVGPAEAPVVLLLHGEPSWSFLYRKMIPVLVKNKFRCIAPDLIGFGKSDKPISLDDYSFRKHIDWVREAIEQLDLKDILLFCQDWGGLIGLRLLAEIPDRFSMAVASNTGLPTGNVEMPQAFLDWQEFSKNTPDFNIAKVIQMGCTETLSPEVLAAYDAPFPSQDYKAGARIFPSLVPTQESDPEAKNNQDAWTKLMTWDKPFLTAFGSKDPITKGAEKIFQAVIPGCKGQDHCLLEAGHFIQETHGVELAQIVSDFYTKNR